MFCPPSFQYVIRIIACLASPPLLPLPRVNSALLSSQSSVPLLCVLFASLVLLLFQSHSWIGYGMERSLAQGGESGVRALFRVSRVSRVSIVSKAM